MDFDNYFEYNNILGLICRTRAKYAISRNKKHILHKLTTSDACRYHLNDPKRRQDTSKEEEFLGLILPSRRKWVNLNRQQRRKKDGQRLNNKEIIERTLLKTIQIIRHKTPDDPKLIKLNEFISDIQNSINNKDYRFEKPEIIPFSEKRRGEVDTKVRPVSKFSLKDNIIISLTSRYFTDQFDEYFFDNSFAFRSSKGSHNSGLKHHNAVEMLIKHCVELNQQEWFVAECDIKKFFDSVNHSIIRKSLHTFISRANRHHQYNIDPRAIRLFYEYLACYNYRTDVLMKNHNQAYWQDYPNLTLTKKFPDFENELLGRGYYKRINKNVKYGIPQGGALSGLIANIALHFADHQALKNSDHKLGYFRYCDDIVILHPKKDITEKTIDCYAKALQKLKLNYHEFIQLDISKKKAFWGTKSKSAYRWGAGHDKGMEWIGFVGYEIRYDFRVRVRKKSLNKEISKQFKVIKQIYSAVKENKRKSNDTVIESATHRLTGMSVGRVTPYNYKQLKPDMCWTHGFRMLNDNPNVRRQLKVLDMKRQKRLKWLKNELKRNPENSNTQLCVVRKLAFTRIKGISPSESEEIRNHLRDHHFLGSKYRFNSGNKSLQPDDLKLPGKFMSFSHQILKVLTNLGKNREVGYYGRPYSYHYQVLKSSNYSGPTSG